MPEIDTKLPEGSIENLPPNSVLLAEAERTREDFYKTLSQILRNIPRPPGGFQYRGPKK